MVTAVPTFDIGDSKYIGNHSSVSGTTAFTNSAGVATDPTEVSLRLKLPDATTVVYRWPTPAVGELQLSKEATGRFYALKTFSLAGTHTWKLTGTGAVAEAAQGRLFVVDDLA